MNSQLLQAMLDALRQTQNGIHSALVVCRGVTVLDACFYPHGPDALHDVRSITKSATSRRFSSTHMEV